MTRVVEVEPRMRAEYDRFIQSIPNGSFRQGYAWGEVMRYDNEVFRLAAIRDGTIVGVLSIQKRQIPRSPFSFFYAPRGPIADFTDRDVVLQLLDGARALGKAHRALFLRIDPDIPDSDELARAQLNAFGFRYLRNKDWSYISYPRVLMRTDLTPSIEDLTKGLRKKHRQHINTRVARGITFNDAKDSEGIRRFYELMVDISHRKGFPLRSFDYYKRLVDDFGDDCRVLIAQHQGRDLAGVMSLIYGNKAWYMHGATLEDKGNLHPAEGLHWDMMCWAKEKGAEFYDFGGTGTEYPPREDNPNYPLYNFKKGFGAEIHYLTGYYDFPFSTMLYPCFRFAEERVLPRAVKAWGRLRNHVSHHE